MFIPKLSGLAGLIMRAAWPGQLTPENLRAAYETGRFHNASPHGFQEGYYPEPEEIREMFAHAGIEEEGMVSIRGLAVGDETALVEARGRDPALGQALDELLDATASDARVVAVCAHALFIGRRSRP